MFTKVTRQNIVQNRIGCIGYSLEEPNRFVYVGSDNLFIQSDLKYKIFSDVYTMKYLRNIIPRYRTPGVITFDVTVYPGSFTGFSEAYITSSTPILAIFGQKFTTATNHVHINLLSKTIKTSSEIFYSAPLNYNTPLYMENQTYNAKGGFFYSTSTLFQTKWDPTYETICYPARFDIRSSSFYEVFENRLQDYVDMPRDIPQSFGIGSTFRMYRPKFLFQPGYLAGTTTWYSYSTETSSLAQQSPDNGTYFTFNEFRTKGNTYKEYLSIPENIFTDLYEGKWTVLVNNYILPIFISSKFWTNKYDFYQFLWAQNVTNKYMFVLGSL